ncbi:glycosyl hydrolase [Pantoea anthophila]|uniref:Glycoside hydrolase n=1 Tax=Pantoea anthophila TaxID=470931 RepID=A0ABY2Z8R4_9GAMM|nr:glycosyl hydrolase [Pantoea anthophila]TPV23642.1 glycoside hydrolase [Pantoea anthophila]
MHPIKPVTLAVLAALSLTGMSQAAEEDPLWQSFQSPPQESRPRVWWHWMNGNISKDGIGKDLEWMKRVGIGGAHSFDINISTPQVVSKRLVYMTPEWQDAFRFAAHKARDLDLELAMASSPGWSETGGPWVTPEDAMKKVVWSETELQPGRGIDGKLPAPPGGNGVYQNLGVEPGLSALTGEAPPVLPSLYKDIAVYAYKIKPAEKPARPDVQINGTAVQPDASGYPFKDVHSDKSTNAVTVDYHAPATFSSLTVFIENLLEEDGADYNATVEASSDGTAWKSIAETRLANIPATVSFSPVTARYFRLTVHAKPAPRTFVSEPRDVAVTGLSSMMGQEENIPHIAQLEFSAESRVNRFQEKAGFAIAGDYYALDRYTDASESGLGKDEIINLTSRLQADGTLKWTPPSEGHWRILRMGYALTGTTNHPAPSEATGFEVDKYDGQAVSRYLTHYLQMYKKTVGSEDLKKAGLSAFVNDSIEVGTSNWTPRLIEQFKKLRGYDPTPWLPALTGVIIISREKTDAFLYDFRKTLSDLIETQHYETIAQIAQAAGLTTYGESLEFGRPVLGDDLDMRRYASIPMAAIWSVPAGKEPTPSAQADIRGAASVAHFYGKKYAASETFTSLLEPWAYSPSDLKHTADDAFLQGMNRPVIHTSPHVPVDDKVPGVSLSVFGQYFNRNETWAEMARPWIDYLARTAMLLQKGQFSADVAYFYGEESGAVTQALNGYMKDVPEHYAYDFVSADSVRSKLSVKDGQLISPAGASYRVLYLNSYTRYMTLGVLKRIAGLVKEGATVVGLKPVRSPSLADDPDEFSRLTGLLWKNKTETAYGDGKVVNSGNIEESMRLLNITPAFIYSAGKPSEIGFVHRRLSDGDIYYVVNQKPEATEVEARFRSQGKKPEIWHPKTASATPVSYRHEGDQTVIPLHLDPGESYFVMFRKNTDRTAEKIDPVTVSKLIDVEGAWDVSFQQHRGAPDKLTMQELKPLDSFSEAGVKYFSGVATYTKTFDVKSPVRKGGKYVLDLGQVGDLAQVTLNGKDVGTLWHAPFKADVSAALKEGKNQLEIRVANLWVNRLIGDAQPDVKEKITYTTVPTYRADAELRPSGLIGPVTVSRYR